MQTENVVPEENAHVPSVVAEAAVDWEAQEEAEHFVRGNSNGEVAATRGVCVCVCAPSNPGYFIQHHLLPFICL